VPARTFNLSAGGMFVATEHPLSEGQLVGLLLELEHCKLPLRGSVVWQRRTSGPGRPTGMGLRLLNPPEPYVKYVDALV
jgi:Tfp pilus assembly protein PilZ